MNIVYKHPIAISFLVLYSIICINFILSEKKFLELVKMHSNENIHSKEWAGVDVFIFGAIFFFISCGYSIGKPKETKFYLWLIAIIIVEAIITLNIDKILLPI